MAQTQPTGSDDLKKAITRKDAAAREYTHLEQERDAVRTRIENVRSRAEMLGDSGSVRELEHLNRKSAEIQQDMRKTQNLIRTLDEQILLETKRLETTEKPQNENSTHSRKEKTTILIDDHTLKNESETPGRHEQSPADRYLDAQRRREWEEKIRSSEREWQVHESIREQRGK